MKGEIDMSVFRLVQDRGIIQELKPIIWEQYGFSEDIFVFFKDDQAIVFGEAEINVNNNGDAYIKMMNSVEKQKGYGRIFIDYLKQLPEIKEIWGEAIPAAVPFWFKMGAKLDQQLFQRYIEEDELEEDFLIPFEIPC